MRNSHYTWQALGGTNATIHCVRAAMQIVVQWPERLARCHPIPCQMGSEVWDTRPLSLCLVKKLQLAPALVLMATRFAFCFEMVPEAWILHANWLFNHLHGTSLSNPCVAFKTPELSYWKRQDVVTALRFWSTPYRTADSSKNSASRLYCSVVLLMCRISFKERRGGEKSSFSLCGADKWLLSCPAAVIDL